VEGRILRADDLAGLRAQARRAVEEEAGVVFVDEGPLGDPLVLLAGLSPLVPGLLLGARLGLPEDGRHPAVLARDMTSLDLVCGGRSVVCFRPPFDDRLAEAIALCRALWREGRADGGGPRFAVQDAVNRPCPDDPGPLVALDLTGGGAPPDTLAAAADLLVCRTDDPTVVRVERP
jgi:alkanesulfonate monooxygenase SsuD/methylene tetrahydromethanopterin reductase-like flavin-dependent oxidoreductase (luciferase family)